MPFKKCPKCGHDVRQVDPNCWSCGAGFDGAKAVIPFTHVRSEEEERFHRLGTLFNEKNHEGLVVVTRFDHAKDYEYPDRVIPVLGLSHDDVARRYRGFDGDCWRVKDDDPWERVRIESALSFLREESGLADLSDFQRLLTLFPGSFSDDSDLIYVGASNRPATLPEPFRFEGYECGYFYSHRAKYSALFWEVIIGHNAEMRQLGNLLNDGLLFSRAEDAERFLTVRSSLVERGGFEGISLEDETDGEFGAIGVWRYQGAPLR
jgi:hypothetical protein